MDDERLETIPVAGDLDPIEEHLTAVATERRLPAHALGMCVARIEESAPTLCALLTRVADGAWLENDEATQFFRGLHVLGAARDTQGFPSLLRLLARPEEDLDYLLGDIVTEALPHIVIGMFDGDTEGLFAAISDSPRSEYVRDALLGAAAFLTWEGRIDRVRMSDFLARFFDTPLAEPGDHAWCGWLEAVGLLGLDELRPRAERVFSEERVDHWAYGRDDLERLLDEAAHAPNDQARLDRSHLGYIEDVVEALRWTDRDEETDPDDLEWRLSGGLQRSDARRAPGPGPQSLASRRPQ